MLKVALNTMTIMPVTGKFNDEKTGKQIEFFQTTMLVPQVHVLAPSSIGSMPQEQIKAVLHQCAENVQEAEIEYSKKHINKLSIKDIESFKENLLNQLLRAPLKIE